MTIKADTSDSETGATRADQTDEFRPRRLANALGLLRTPGTGQAQRWFFSGIWLVYLISPVSDLFSDHHGVLWIAAAWPSRPPSASST